VRASVLDNKVKAARAGAARAGEDEAPSTPEPGPWPEKVDGDALLDALVAAFRQYIVMELAGLQILALSLSVASSQGTVFCFIEKTPSREQRVSRRACVA
jgi:hypothetical protein